MVCIITGKSHEIVVPYKNGRSKAAIARKVHVSLPTVYRWINRAAVDPDPQDKSRPNRKKSISNLDQTKIIAQFKGNRNPSRRKAAKKFTSTSTTI